MEYPPRLPRVEENLNESILLTSIINDIFKSEDCYTGHHMFPTRTIDNYCTIDCLNADYDVIEWVRQWMKLVSFNSNILSRFECNTINFSTNDNVEDLSEFNYNIIDYITLRKLIEIIALPYDLLRSKYGYVMIHRIHMNVQSIVVEFITEKMIGSR